MSDWREYEPLEFPRILDAALQAFYEHGYHGTTTRDLARRSGLSVPGVYHYYPSKQDILVDLMTVIIDELLTRSRQALDSAAPGARPRFDALVESMLRFHMYRRTGAIVSTGELRSLEPGNRERYVAKRDEQQRMLDEVILAGVRDGDFSTPYPEGRQPGHRVAVCGCRLVVPAGREPAGRGAPRPLPDHRAVDRGHQRRDATVSSAVRSAVVTGASRGIGRGIALDLAVPRAGR